MIMKKLNIIADDKIPFLKGTLENYCNIKYLAGVKTTAETIKDNHPEILITRTRTKCDAQLLNNSSVKFIGTATIGHDHIDKLFCKKNNINWKNAPGCNANSVAQYIASAIINIVAEDNLDLENLTLGIVGVGNVGTAVMAMAKKLGLKILLNDPPKAEKKLNDDENQYHSLDHILENSDIITMHTPLSFNKNGEKHPTFHLANADFFKKMKKNAYFINSGRGEVANTDELKNAIKNNLIKDAVIDVWENEPNINIELLELVRYSTPHIAGYSLDGKANGTAQIVNKIACFFTELPKELQTWYPANIPLPLNHNIVIDCSNFIDSFNETEIIYKIINESYNIKNDSKSLKENYTNFEDLRGNYPLRREFKAFTITFINHKTIMNNHKFKKLITILGNLNFKVTCK